MDNNLKIASNEMFASQHKAFQPETEKQPGKKYQDRRDTSRYWYTEDQTTDLPVKKEQKQKATTAGSNLHDLYAAPITNYKQEVLVTQQNKAYVTY